MARAEQLDAIGRRHLPDGDVEEGGYREEAPVARARGHERLAAQARDAEQREARDEAGHSAEAPDRELREDDLHEGPVAAPGEGERGQHEQRPGDRGALAPPSIGHLRALSAIGRASWSSVSQGNMIQVSWLTSVT